VDTAREQVKNCSGFLLLTGNDSSLDSLFCCGRLHLNLGLKLAELGIAYHTVSQMLEEEPWSSETASSLGLECPVQFIIRIGYGDSSKPSKSRSLQSFVVA